VLLLRNKDQEFHPLASFATCLCRQRIEPEPSPEGGFTFVQGA